MTEELANPHADDANAQVSGHFSFTWFKPFGKCPTEISEEEMKTALERLPLKRYAIQVETCPTTGRPHLQCYVESIKRQRYSAIQGWFPGISYLKTCSKYAAKAFTYCQKERSRTGWSICLGEPVVRESGARRDLEAGVELIRQGGLTRLVDEMPEVYAKYGGHMEKLAVMMHRKSLMQYHKPYVQVLWGDTGAGKTRLVADRHPGDIYPLEVDDCGKLWFSGYLDQRVLLLDEFYGQIKASLILKLLDAYRRQWPTKGGFVMGKWTHVYITSNTHPSTWYPNIPAPVRAAIDRRITHVKFMGAQPGPGGVFTNRGDDLCPGTDDGEGEVAQPGGAAE